MKRKIGKGIRKERKEKSTKQYFMNNPKYVPQGGKYFTEA